MLTANLKKKFGTFSLDVSLEVRDELLVLFGPSGSGKTLTLQCIAGLIKPDEGLVSMKGNIFFESAKGINLPLNKRHIGYVFQDYALFPHMTIYDNIAYGISACPRVEIKERVHELISILRLDGLENRHPHELSGGQRQRAAIARAIVVNPSIILLDEPFTALDNPVRSKLRLDLKRIRKKYGTPGILVTHDMEEAFILGDRVAVMNEGRIEQTGSREDIFYRPRSKKVAKFLGIKNILKGQVQEVNDDSIVIASHGFSVGAQKVSPLRVGEKIDYCIRPEEIMILREDRPLGGMPGNIIQGKITEIFEHGSYFLILFHATSGIYLQINVPSYAFKKLQLHEGKEIKVLLKREHLWVIPERQG